MIPEDKKDIETLRKIFFDLYEELHEPERSQAKNNWDYDFALKYNMLPKAPDKAVKFGFDWGSSPEGFDYWGDFEDRYYSGEYFENNEESIKESKEETLIKKLIEQIKNGSIPENYDPNSLGQAMTHSNYFKGIKKAIEILESNLSK